MSEQAMRRVVDSYIRAYNAMDVEAMLSTLHHDIVFENISNDVVDTRAVGIAEFRQLATKSAGQFLSRQQTITGFNVEGDRVLVEIDFEGVIAAEPPNDMQRLQLTGMSEFEFTDGLISRLTDRS